MNENRKKRTERRLSAYTDFLGYENFQLEICFNGKVSEILKIRQYFYQPCCHLAQGKPVKKQHFWRNSSTKAFSETMFNVNQTINKKIKNISFSARQKRYFHKKCYHNLQLQILTNDLIFCETVALNVCISAHPSLSGEPIYSLPKQ